MGYRTALFKPLIRNIYWYIINKIERKICFVKRVRLLPFLANVYSLHTMLQLNFLNYKNQTMSYVTNWSKKDIKFTRSIQNFDSVGEDATHQFITSILWINL